MNDQFRQRITSVTRQRVGDFLHNERNPKQYTKSDRVESSLKEFGKASGYKVSARLLNAMYFHVPQSRQRLIFIGVCDDLGIEPSHPRAESKPIDIKQAFINCKSIHVPYLLNGEVSRIIKNMRPGEDGGKASYRLTGNRNKWFNLRRLSYDTTGFTITKSEGSSALVHPIENRVLSIQEYKRVGSFPDNYKMAGKYQKQKMRIGNSVPPLFMEAIARHIRNEILDKTAVIKS